MQACPLLPEQASQLYASLSLYERFKAALLTQPWFDKDALRIYASLALFALFARAFPRRFASAGALGLLVLVQIGVEAIDSAWILHNPTWSRAGWLGDTLSDLANGLLLPGLLWIYARGRLGKLKVPTVPESADQNTE